jgi:hypothetical protein
VVWHSLLVRLILFHTTMMEADPESSANIETIISPPDDDDDDEEDIASGRRNSGSRAERSDEEGQTRNNTSKRRRVTFDGPPTAPRSPSSITSSTARTCALNKIIVQDLRSNDADTLVKALVEIWSVHLNGTRVNDLEEMQDEFFVCGGHTVVSWIMERHFDRADIQHHAIAVLLQAAYNNRKLAMAIGKTRGIHAVYAAVRRFPHEYDDIVLGGLVAMSHFATDQEANCVLMVEELDAALPFLMQLMGSSSSSLLQHHVPAVKASCRLLLSISKFPQLRHRIIEAKALSSLGHAIENHRADDEIQDWANRALALLSDRSSTTTNY